MFADYKHCDRMAGGILAAALLTACTTPPVIDRTGIDSTLTPAVATGNPTLVGQHANWGGQILSTTNCTGQTRLDVLAFPLNDNGVPQAQRNSIGRIVINYPGFLEPQDYRPSRYVTAVGVVNTAVTATVGGARIQTPVLNASHIALILVDAGPGWRPLFSIGVGIGL